MNSLSGLEGKPCFLDTYVHIVDAEVVTRREGGVAQGMPGFSCVYTLVKLVFGVTLLVIHRPIEVASLLHIRAKSMHCVRQTGKSVVSSNCIRSTRQLSCLSASRIAWSSTSSSRSSFSRSFLVRNTFRSAHSSHQSSAMSTDVSQSTAAMHSEYEKWVRRLYTTNLFHPVKMGLQNIQQLHDLLGNPMDKTTVIHIAGTNGKGSVALKIAKTIEASNPDLKVGLFCSPHVCSFRERMQINGQLISEEDVVGYLPKIYELCEKHDIPATFFEITTALAFQYYAAKQADVVVLETGLGGRLDATNVVKAPAISVITSIGLEHTRILGDTVELIALEKGGIMKKGCPVLVGPNVPHAVLRQCAVDKAAGPYYTCNDVLGEPTDEEKEQLLDYDLENARTATAAIRILLQSNLIPPVSDTAIAKGASQRPPCRFEHVQLESGLVAILDVAHNPDAMEYMVHKLQKTYPDKKFRIIVGMSSDKDLKLCGDSVLGLVNGDQSRVHLVQAAHPRAATLKQILEKTGMEKAHYSLEDPSIGLQIRQAMDVAVKNDELLIVCGSVFLMAEAREALGFDEPRDSAYIAEVAGAGFRNSQENFGNSTVPV